MIKRDELSIGTSCLSRAAHDEPIFVLRANDPLAAQTVRQWARDYRYAKTDANGRTTDQQHTKYLEANALADQMDAWRKLTKRL
jgi:hypothetical protein